jgi:hypothetical protein
MATCVGRGEGVTTEIETRDFMSTMNQLVAHLESHREKQERRVAEARRALDATQQGLDKIERRIRTVEAVRDLYLDLRGELTEMTADVREQIPAQSPATDRPFAGMTVRDALVRVAQDNGGILDSGAACRRLVAAGMFRDMRHAGSNVYPVLSRGMDLFERIGKGRYRLVGTEDSTEEEQFSMDDSDGNTGSTPNGHHHDLVRQLTPPLIGEVTHALV